MLGSTPSRRQFLHAVGALGLGAVAAACTKGSTTDNPTGAAPSGAPGSMNAMKNGATQLSLLSSNTKVNPGKQRFGFDLVASDGSLISSGSPEVWLATDPAAKARGPYASTWYEFTGYGKTGDHSPKTVIPGTFVADIDIPETGNWFVAATIESGSHRAFGSGGLPVVSGKVPCQIGAKATPVATPVATTTNGLEAICTRIPVCHLHSISLDKALANGKPTVISFSTPLLCQSQMCGPVLDELILVSQAKAGKANFVHVEEFLPGPDHKPPAATLANQSPGFKAWKLETEPWTVVVDGKGIIRWHAEGPAMAPEIEAALNKVL